jgi:hypothetical protein
MVAGKVNEQKDASDPVYNASTFITGNTKNPVRNLNEISALRNHLADELPDEFYEFTAADYARLKANKPGKTSAECVFLGGSAGLMFGETIYVRSSRVVFWNLLRCSSKLTRRPSFLVTATWSGC